MLNVVMTYRINTFVLKLALFNVDELTRKSLVISMNESGAKLSYHFKK